MGIVGVPFADDLRRRPSRLGLTAPLGQPGFPLGNHPQDRADRHPAALERSLISLELQRLVNRQIALDAVLGTPYASHSALTFAKSRDRFIPRQRVPYRR